MSDTTRPTREQIESTIKLDPQYNAQKYARYCLALLDENANLNKRVQELEEVAEFAGKVFKILDGATVKRIPTGDDRTREYLGPDQIAERLVSEHSELRSENANLKRDKERLDWWLEHRYWLRAPGDYGGQKTKWRVYCGEQIVAVGESPYEAIDAAMESTASEGKA